MLRFIILMMLATSAIAQELGGDANLLAQVQMFASDINNSVPINPALKEIDGVAAVSKAKAPPLIIFISTSMPKTSIQQWARQADLLGAELVIRGFVNNSFKDTVMLAQELFVKDKVGGFNVDPFKFKLYNITAVPCVVLDVNKNIDMVLGDIGLIEALKIIQARGVNAIIAQQYLSKI